MFHRSEGMMRIRANISAPCAVLDFPTRDDFARPLKTNHCNVVGISGLIVNVRKQECAETRKKTGIIPFLGTSVQSLAQTQGARLACFAGRQQAQNFA
jgi:hypothetical protein